MGGTAQSQGMRLLQDTESGLMTGLGTSIYIRACERVYGIRALESAMGPGEIGRIVVLYPF